MRCPNDQATLVMSERSGVEIDYCPECRGVWLDRGELDKIIDKAGAQPVAPAAGAGVGAAMPRGGYASPGSPGSPASWDRGGRFGRGGYGQQQYGQQQYGQQQYGQQPYGRKRKGNWLSELFD